MTGLKQVPSLQNQPDVHLKPHVPQLAGSELVWSSQPLEFFRSQLLQPGAQLRVHTPAAQTGLFVPPSGCVLLPQTAPQAPQFRRSADVLCSQPFAGFPSQSA
jgi:hypothetical protein